MKEKDLKQLSIDIVEKKVFGSFYMSEQAMNQLGTVFMPFLFLSEEQKKEMQDQEILHLYEYYDKARPSSIDGMPIFSSMREINKTDWTKIVQYIKEYKARVKSFLRTKEKEPEEPTLFDESVK